jgi:hypothetical protein
VKLKANSAAVAAKLPMTTSGMKRIRLGRERDIDANDRISSAIKSTRAVATSAIFDRASHLRKANLRWLAGSHTWSHDPKTSRRWMVLMAAELVAGCATKCGGENPAGEKFCGGCASALSAGCSQCGAENSPSFKFLWRLRSGHRFRLGYTHRSSRQSLGRRGRSRAAASDSAVLRLGGSRPRSRQKSILRTGERSSPSAMAPRRRQLNLL